MRSFSLKDQTTSCFEETLEANLLVKKNAGTIMTTMRILAVKKPD